MEICQIGIKFGFWKNFVVFSLLVSDFRAVWWQKDSHLQLSAMTDFHNRIKKLGAGHFFFFGGGGGGGDENLLINLLLPKERPIKTDLINTSNGYLKLIVRVLQNI